MDQFSIQVKCFQLLGLHRHQLENRLKFRYFLHLLIAAPLIFGVSSVISFVVDNYSDILASAEASGIMFTGIITLSKLGTFFFSKEKLFEIMDRIKLFSERGKIIC